MRFEERMEERRMRYQAFSGVFEFFGVIGSALLILALIVLLVNLGAWLVNDLSLSFSLLQQSVTEAIIVK